MKTKMIRTGIVLILSGILIGTQTNAQSSLQVDKLENKAYKAFTNKDYKKSLVYLLQLDSMVATPNAYYDYMIGMCLLSTDAKIQAIPYLEKAKQSGQISFVIDYYLGRAYQFAGRYEEAKSYLSSYASELAASAIKLSEETSINDADRVHVQKTLNDVRGFIAECELALTSPNFSTVK